MLIVMPEIMVGSKVVASETMVVGSRLEIVARVLPLLLMGGDDDDDADGCI
jgi:hypothetical protein